MSQEPENSQNKAYSEVTIRLPERIVRRFNELKAQWGIELRCAVLERFSTKVSKKIKIIQRVNVESRLKYFSP